jgi:hypothetical protein
VSGFLALQFREFRLVQFVGEPEERRFDTGILDAIEKVEVPLRRCHQL